MKYAIVQFGSKPKRYTYANDVGAIVGSKYCNVYIVGESDSISFDAPS